MYATLSLPYCAKSTERKSGYVASKYLDPNEFFTHGQISLSTTLLPILTTHNVLEWSKQPHRESYYLLG